MGFGEIRMLKIALCGGISGENLGNLAFSENLNSKNARNSSFKRCEISQNAEISPLNSREFRQNAEISLSNLSEFKQSTINSCEFGREIQPNVDFSADFSREFKKNSPFKQICLNLIAFYQRYLSPLKPRCCRFYPSCSEFARISFEKNGVFVGFWASLWRILRCHPFNKGGFDYPKVRKDRLFKDFAYQKTRENKLFKDLAYRKTRENRLLRDFIFAKARVNSSLKGFEFLNSRQNFNELNSSKMPKNSILKEQGRARKLKFLYIPCDERWLNIVKIVF